MENKVTPELTDDLTGILNKMLESLIVITKTNLVIIDKLEEIESKWETTKEK